MGAHGVRWLAAAAIVAALAAPAGAGEDAGRPALGDLMLLTQFRQVKLWYAEKAENWRLAAFEFDRLAGTIDRIATLYPSSGSLSLQSEIREKTDPVMADLKRAIEARDKAGFEAAYGRVTDACNGCHEAAGLGFIAVRVPTKSPFANQLFEPQR